MTAVPPEFSWTGGAIHPEVIAACGLLAAGWAWAWHARGRRPGPARAARFLGGLLALLLALNGPLHDLSDWYLFSAHMVQHLVLTLVVPPLLLTGVPGWMVDGLLQPVMARRAGAAIVRMATHPLAAFAAYAVALIAWHLPGPYNTALEIHGWHVVEHLVLLAAAGLGWWPIVSPSRLAPALPYAAQLLYLFVFGMPMTVVAAMITAAERVLYPFYASAPRLFDLTPLADQRLGGVIMWVPSGLIPLMAFTLVFFRWVAAEAEEAA
ncbi:MAG TPA: cytochrome c oxidase assembly protein [Candidatus Limnocylindria bacterium]